MLDIDFNYLQVIIKVNSFASLTIYFNFKLNFEAILVYQSNFKLKHFLLIAFTFTKAIINYELIYVKPSYFNYCQFPILNFKCLKIQFRWINS